MNAEDQHGGLRRVRKPDLRSRGADGAWDRDPRKPRS